jgi:hypothetical protein
VAILQVVVLLVWFVVGVFEVMLLFFEFFFFFFLLIYLSRCSSISGKICFKVNLDPKFCMFYVFEIV